jgi:hypothetical protein
MFCSRNNWIIVIPLPWHTKKLIQPWSFSKHVPVHTCYVNTTFDFAFTFNLFNVDYNPAFAIAEWAVLIEF